MLLDVPGGTYWQGWRRFVAEQVADQGYIGPDDLDLAPLTDDIREALAHIDRFYLNYHRSAGWATAWSSGWISRQMPRSSPS